MKKSKNSFLLLKYIIQNCDFFNLFLYMFELTASLALEKKNLETNGQTELKHYFLK